MKKYLILVVAGVLAMGCKQSEIQTINHPQQGELIEVALTLPVDQAQAVSRADEATTASWSGNGFEAQITTEPIDTPMSKAVNESTVINVWVLQFDGTEPTSKLIYKHYVENYIAGSTVQLLKATTANRVAIVANTFDATWANDFTLNSTTWETISTKSLTVAAQIDVLRGTDYLPMSGSSIGTVSIGGTLNIELTRTVVQVVVNLRAGGSITATTMGVQMCGVPNATSWFPDTGTGVWPASPTVINYASENVTGITTTDFVSRTFWVPVNRRGTVAGTTGLTRASKAPAGATYLRISAGSWVYKIHLGNDHATDYNLKANTKYTYSLTLQTDPTGADSRAKQYIEIGDLRWATGNLVAMGSNGCKIGAPTDYGLYFHFGSLVGWSGGANGDGVGTGKPDLAIQVKPNEYTGSTWPAGSYAGGDAGTGYGLPATDDVSTGIGDPCRYYLGAPWRTPTATEWSGLFAGVTATTSWADLADWDWQATPAGALSTSSLFFPASGLRYNSNGSFYNVTTYGYYWSSSVNNASSGYNLYFYPAYGVIPQNNDSPSYGFPVRCVSGTQVPPPTVPNPPTASDYITIDGLKWAKGNLVAVDGGNAKVGVPADYGLYFHFGSLVGWSGGANGNGVGTGKPTLAVRVQPTGYTGSFAWSAGYYQDGSTLNTGYGLPDTDVSATGVGDPCRVYLGAPWRTPTATEYRVLFDEKTALTAWGSIPGWNWDPTLRGAKGSSDLFFPASGLRDYSDGSFYNVTTSGYGWSSSVYSAANGYSLSFGQSNGVAPQNDYKRAYGFPVRCVSGTQVPPPTVLSYGVAPHAVTTDLSGSVTTSYNAWKGTVDGGNAVNGGNGAYYTSVADAYSGEKPYYKFEVAKADEAVGLNWQATRAACLAKAPVGQWRLPRLSELRLIYLNKTSLEATVGFSAFGSANYWSATEYGAPNAWYVNLGNGSANANNEAGTGYRARCVREVSE